MSRSNIKPGDKFGRLIVIKECGRSKDRRVLWLCLCNCGNEKITNSTLLLKGKTKSCGCLHIENTINLKYKHGFTGSRLHNIWCGLFYRCENLNCKDWKYYGGRGIKVCDEWREFKRFRRWAINNGHKPKLVLDRIDNDGDYSPKNCRWISQGGNVRNSRATKLIVEEVKNIKGLLKIQKEGRIRLKDIANMYGISIGGIHGIKSGRVWKEIYHESKINEVGREL